MTDDDNYTSYKFSLERLAALLLVLGALVYCIGIYRRGTIDPLIVVPDMARQIFGIFQYQFLQIQKNFAGANWFGLRLDVASFLILAGPMLGALLLEVLWMARRERSFKNGWRHTSLARMLAFKDPSVRTDVYMLAYQVLALDRLVVALLGLLGPFIIYGLLVNTFPGISLSHYVELHPAVGFIIYVLVADFMGYWYHRWAHHFRCLWELHKFHHSATSMNMITAHRNHPFEGAMRMPIKAVAVIVVGPGLDHYLIYNALI